MIFAVKKFFILLSILFAVFCDLCALCDVSLFMVFPYCDGWKCHEIYYLKNLLKFSNFRNSFDEQEQLLQFRAT